MPSICVGERETERESAQVVAHEPSSVIILGMRCVGRQVRGGTIYVLGDLFSRAGLYPDWAFK